MCLSVSVSLDSLIDPCLIHQELRVRSQELSARDEAAETLQEQYELAGKSIADLTGRVQQLKSELSDAMAQQEGLE